MNVSMTQGPTERLPSVALRLGWISLGLGCASILAAVPLGGLGGEFEGAGPEILLTFFLPFAVLPFLALGTVGAAFAEGVLKRSSLVGLLFALIGASLPWIVERLCCG
jgi:hypothetical protein